VLLGCPHPGHTETVNDIDALLSNFWRALQHDPEAVATAADWPVNEVDLHARHRYLRDRRGWVEELLTDPTAYDTELAGWWVWGISQWIGSGWCPPAGVADVRKLPHVGNAGRGVHRGSLHDIPQKLPSLGGGHGGNGQMPHVGAGWRGTEKGSGVHRVALAERGGLYAYFEALAARLRRVRVCCGDWRRVLGPSVTFRHGLTAVFLDPPYVQEGRADVYGFEDRIFADVRQWAIEHGDNDLLRIALCGYDFEMPDGWQSLAWKAHGGYGNQGTGQGRANASREVIWFSPACLDPAELARESFSRPISVRESDYTGTLFDFEETL